MDGYLGQIILFAGDFAPKGWAFCNGQLMLISEYEALYSVIGVAYGGNGTSNFALPDLRGRVPVHSGKGPGVEKFWQLGERFGSDTITLDISEMPNHTHATTTTAPQAQVAVTDDFVSTTVKVPVTKEDAGTDDPTNAILAKVTDTKGNTKSYSTGASDGYLKEFAADVTVDPTSIGVNVGKPGVAILDTGGSQEHLNIQPSLATNYIICINGQYPIRD
jgi:microcystin-dependent protein